MTTQANTPAEKSKKELKNDQKRALCAAFVKEYGENAIVTRMQLKTIWEKNRPAYPHLVTIRKNPDYKVARNAFICTTADTPEGVRAARDKAKMTYVPPVKAVKAPKAAKLTKSAAEITKEILDAGLTVPEKKAKAKKPNAADAPVTVEDAETLGNDTTDINDIMKVAQAG